MFEINVAKVALPTQFFNEFQLLQAFYFIRDFVVNKMFFLGLRNAVGCRTINVVGII